MEEPPRWGVIQSCLTILAITIVVLLLLDMAVQLLLL